MKYWKIDEHITTKFLLDEKIEILNSITDEKIKTMPDNKIYKIQIISLAIDIVNSKNISTWYGPKQWSKIISEFMFGITKIIRDFKGKWITIQGDAIKCIFNATNKEDIDISFNCACLINSFMKHLNKKIKSTNSIFPNFYELKIGIGLWFSFENYASNVGIKQNRDIVFIGESVNYASELANNANRNGNPPILFNNLFKESFTEEEKKMQNKIGGIIKLYLNYYDIWGCDYISIKYDNYVENNV